MTGGEIMQVMDPSMEQCESDAYDRATARDALWAVEDAAQKTSRLGLVIANEFVEDEKTVEAGDRDLPSIVSQAYHCASLGHSVRRTQGLPTRESEVLTRAADAAQVIAELLREAASVARAYERREDQDFREGQR